MTFKEFIPKLTSWLFDIVMSLGFKILVAVLALILGFKTVGWILRLIRRNKRFETIDPGAETFIVSFLAIALKLVVVLTAVAIIGVPMTNFIAVLGSAGLAVGLALQGSLSNLAGGLMILIFRPFGVGDYIDGAEVSGTVQEINILYTVLNTPDNIRIVVPNGSLSNATVKNYSVNETRRVDLEFGVAYKSDLKQVISILQDMGASHELVLKDKDVFVKISSYDESQITVKLRVWVKASDYWTVYFDLTEKAKELFDANDIEIPFPQLDVHFDKE